MMYKYKPNQTIYCPHCGAEWDETADMYVIPGRDGIESVASEQCWNCNIFSDVARYGDEIHVTKAEV